MVVAGLSQKWNLFAPNTYTENIYVNAAVTLRNGQTKIWAPQRPIMLGYIDRYFKAHYRNFWTSAYLFMPMFGPTQHVISLASTVTSLARLQLCA
jgi:hypothetical protein